MNLVNLIKICLLNAVLLYTDALSIEKCKTLNCLTALTSTKLNAIKANLNVASTTTRQPIIRNIQLNNQLRLSNLSSAALNNEQSNSQYELNKQVNQQSNEQLNATNELKKVLNNGEERRIDAKKSIRTRREPRGGRIGGKGSGTGLGGKRTGAKQDGNDNNNEEDSGSFKLKPIYSLVILSIVFVFI